MTNADSGIDLGSDLGEGLFRRVLDIALEAKLNDLADARLVADIDEIDVTEPHRLGDLSIATAHVPVWMIATG